MVSIGGSWWEFKDDDGFPYYYNEKSKETQWEKPTLQADELPPPPPPSKPADRIKQDESRRRAARRAHQSRRRPHRHASKTPRGTGDRGTGDRGTGDRGTGGRGLAASADRSKMRHSLERRKRKEKERRRAAKAADEENGESSKESNSSPRNIAGESQQREVNELTISSSAPSGAVSWSSVRQATAAATIAAAMNGGGSTTRRSANSTAAPLPSSLSPRMSPRMSPRGTSSSPVMMKGQLRSSANSVAAATAAANRAAVPPIALPNAFGESPPLSPTRTPRRANIAHASMKAAMVNDASNNNAASNGASKKKVQMAPADEIVTPRSRSSSSTTSALEIKRTDARDAFEAKRKKRRSVYTTNILKPSDGGKGESGERDRYFRQMLLGEILDTELEYLDHLKFVVTRFLQGARTARVLDENGIDTLFGGIEAIRDVSQDLTDALRARLEDRESAQFECVGDVLCAFVERFKAVYPNYCVAHDSAALYAASLPTANKQAADFFASVLRGDDAELISVSSYLIKPVQRIMKYPLLLSELLKYTDEQHADHAALRDAERLTRGVAHFINTHKSTEEGRRRWTELAPSVESESGFDVRGQRRVLLRDAELACGVAGGDTKVAHIATRRVWLCNDVLLCGAKGRAKKYKLTDVFRMSASASAVVRHSTKHKDFRHALQILSFARDSQPLVLGFASAATREDWFALMNSLMKSEFERERERTAAKLGSQDSAAMSESAKQLHIGSVEALSDAELRDALSAAFRAFVDSESEYVRKLQVAVRVYILPMQRIAKLPAQLTTFFQCFEAILKLHSDTILAKVVDVDASGDAQQLALAIVEAIGALSGDFSGYERHAGLFEPAMALFERLTRPGTPMLSVLETARQQVTSSDMADVDKLLALPSVRVARYVPLLQRLALCTRSQVDAAQFAYAVSTAQRLVAVQETAAHRTRLERLNASLKGVPSDKPIVAANRRLLLDSPVRVNGKQYHAWLCSDRLIYGKPNKSSFQYKGEFSLVNQTLIRDVIDTKTVANTIELVRLSDRSTVQFAMPTSAAKELWRRTASEAIKEHLRAIQTVRDGMSPMATSPAVAASRLQPLSPRNRSNSAQPSNPVQSLTARPRAARRSISANTLPTVLPAPLTIDDTVNAMPRGVSASNHSGSTKKAVDAALAAANSPLDEREDSDGDPPPPPPPAGEQ